MSESSYDLNITSGHIGKKDFSRRLNDLANDYFNHQREVNRLVEKLIHCLDRLNRVCHKMKLTEENKSKIDWAIACIVWLSGRELSPIQGEILYKHMMEHAKSKTDKSWDIKEHLVNKIMYIEKLIKSQECRETRSKSSKLGRSVILEDEYYEEDGFIEDNNFIEENGEEEIITIEPVSRYTSPSRYTSSTRSSRNIPIEVYTLPERSLRSISSRPASTKNVPTKVFTIPNESSRYISPTRSSRSVPNKVYPEYTDY